MNGLIFEDTTSPLYYSNDGKIRYGRHDDVHFVFDADTEEILLETHNRALADAYIAGWDACERFTREGRV